MIFSLVYQTVCLYRAIFKTETSYKLWVMTYETFGLLIYTRIKLKPIPWQFVSKPFKIKILELIYLNQVTELSYPFDLRSN